MRKTLRVAAAFASGMTVLGVVAGPVAASQPAFHSVEEVTGETFTCTSTSYTITAGSIRITIHEGESNTGNLNFTGTVTPLGVVAEDPAGNEVAIRGAGWFGGTANALSGTEQFWNTEKFQLIDQGGGTIDSVNVTFFIQFVNGEPTNVKDFDFGNCATPEEPEGQ